jgi:hypothetical protein
VASSPAIAANAKRLAPLASWALNFSSPINFFLASSNCDNEDVQCMQAIKDFIDKHGDARFSLANGEDKYIIHNRAGYYLMEDAPANAKDTKCRWQARQQLMPRRSV